MIYAGPLERPDGDEVVGINIQCGRLKVISECARGTRGYRSDRNSMILVGAHQRFDFVSLGESVVKEARLAQLKVVVYYR